MNCRDIVQHSLPHYVQLADDGRDMLHGVAFKTGYYLIGTEQYGEKLPVGSYALIKMC